jgi:hypothetical protein
MSILVPKEGRILRYAYDKSVQFSEKQDVEIAEIELSDTLGFMDVFGIRLGGIWSHELILGYLRKTEQMRENTTLLRS